jgi:gas vesicle structural protein
MSDDRLPLDERVRLPLDERVRLVELVDRVLDRGVVLRGDVIISVAGIDLVYLELRLLLVSMETLDRARLGEID